MILESTAAAPTFRGFLIQARLVADDSTVVGQFEEPPVGGEYRYGFCTNREVGLRKDIYLYILPLQQKIKLYVLYVTHCYYFISCVCECVFVIRHTDCMQGSVTHNTGSEKPTIILPWRAPSNGTGTIHFG